MSAAPRPKSAAVTRSAVLLGGLLLVGCATTVMTHDSGLEASQGVAVLSNRGDFSIDVPPAFADRSRGWMGGKALGLMGWKVYKTTDGGESWTSTGSLGDFTAERLMVDPSGALVAVTPAHEIFVSRDDGETWQGPR